MIFTGSFTVLFIFPIKLWLTALGESGVTVGSRIGPLTPTGIEIMLSPRTLLTSGM